MLAVLGIPGLGAGEMFICCMMIVPMLIVVALVVWLVGQSQKRSQGAPPSTYSAPRREPEVPAGWYADPLTPGQMRYWNGREWTQDVHKTTAE